MSVLWRYIFRKRPELEILKESLIFEGLSRGELERLLDYLYERDYGKGEEIIRFGEPGYALYLVKSGCVSVEIPTDGGMVEVDTIGPGEFFGEIAVVAEAPRTATVRAKEDTSVFVFTRSALEDLMETHPRTAAKILYKIAGIIAQRLAKLNEQLKEK